MNADHIATLRRARITGLLKTPQLVLLMLANRGRYGWRLSDLAEAADISAPAVNMAKEQLLKKGWAVEQFPERDKRVVKLYLTDAGHKHACHMWSAVKGLAGIEKAWRSSQPDQN